MKIGGNVDRDLAVRARLLDAGWRIATVWECSIKGRNRRPLSEVIDSLALWLSSDEKEFFIGEQSVDEPGIRPA